MDSHDELLAKIADTTLPKPTAGFIKKIATVLGGSSAHPWYSQHSDTHTQKALASPTTPHATGLLGRAQERALFEAAREQRNIEAPILKALPNIKEDAKPDDVEDDWMANFFDKCRIISNEQMQDLWAQVLAGEVNNPGTFSKRTINFLSTLTQSEAILFREVCSLMWKITDTGASVLLINTGKLKELPLEIKFSHLKHLHDIGLIAMSPGDLGGYALRTLKLQLTYYSQIIEVEHKEGDTSATYDMGNVMLTNMGEELASICDVSEVTCNVEYAIEHLFSKYQVSCPVPLQRPSEDLYS